MKMREILSALMSKYGDDPYTLEAKSGVPQPTTQRFLSGKHKSANSETVEKWAAAYNVTASQLRGDVPLDSNYLPPTHIVPRIPVVDKGMGDLPDNVVFLSPKEHKKFLSSSVEYAEVYSSDPDAFITVVEDNSMFPKYHHHGYALIEPNEDVEIEDNVLIKISTGKVLLRRLVSRRGGIVLSSYNDTEILSFPTDQVNWMYYVAHPVPARKIKSRV